MGKKKKAEEEVQYRHPDRGVIGTIDVRYLPFEFVIHEGTLS
jgi:hypothetical protein